MVVEETILTHILLMVSASMLWLFVSPTKIRQVLEVFKWNKETKQEENV